MIHTVPSSIFAAPKNQKIPFPRAFRKTIRSSFVPQVRIPPYTLLFVFFVLRNESVPEDGYPARPAISFPSQHALPFRSFPNNQ